mmetsp:Transcript_14318/g.36462  ORF Transcript_14318/g.36462 Transcript_14318/m.36462 type:complete len:86 (+) Transcript_14318:371-628(+)
MKTNLLEQTETDTISIFHGHHQDDFKGYSVQPPFVISSFPQNTSVTIRDKTWKQKEEQERSTKKRKNEKTKKQKKCVRPQRSFFL